MCAVTGAAERLGGLSTICYDLSFAEMAKGGLKPQDGPTSIYSFLARTLAEQTTDRTIADKMRSLADLCDAAFAAMATPDEVPLPQPAYEDA